MDIEWPEDWDPTEGWPNTKTPGKVLGRSWSGLNGALKRQGTSLLQLKIEMGAPYRPRLRLCTTRTISSLKKEIRTFVKEHGVAPHAGTSKKWQKWVNHNTWLSKRKDTTLLKLCVEMGYSPLRCETRTLPDIKKEIRAYVKEHGETPHLETSKGWTNHSHWLRKQQGFSLHQLCIEMGYNPRLCTTRTLPNIKKEIRAHVKEHGKSPQAGNSKKWANHNAWLTHRGILPLFQLSIEMGCTPTQNHTRTIPVVKKEIRAFVKEHGNTPAQGTAKKWANHDAWLRSHGSSLSQLCLKMGYSPSQCTTRTLPGVKKEIRAFVKEHGKTPSQGISKKWANHNTWLSVQGTSLSQLCIEMGYAPTRCRTRTLPSIKKEIRAFVKEHREAPHVGSSERWRKWVNHNTWLKRQGSSLHQLCVEMKLK